MDSLLEKFLKGVYLSEKDLLKVISEARLLVERVASEILKSDSNDEESLKELIGNTMVSVATQRRAAEKLFEMNSQSMGVCRFILENLPDSNTEHKVKAFKIKIGRILIENENVEDLKLVYRYVDPLAGEVIAQLVNIKKILAKRELEEFFRISK